ncbi:hypothetical protein C2S51_036297 [Perilla frutescens var. frutescens]|nr:hypothetical protein C2S51_036297 [Perilla frutescens var. frutescens]
MDALKIAQDEHKFMFIETLCSELVEQFLGDNNLAVLQQLAISAENSHSNAVKKCEVTQLVSDVGGRKSAYKLFDEMSLCFRLRPPLTTAQKPSTKVSKLSIRSCSVPPQNTRKLVAEVKEKLEKEHKCLPVGKYGRDDEEMILSFLKDRKFSVEETASKLTKAIEYESYEDEKLCVFLIEKALSKLPAGKQEVLVIMDLRGFQAQNSDLKFLTFVFDAFYYYYPRRLGQVLFVDAPFIFKPFWQLVKPLLKSYASLVRFCSAKEVKEEYFTADTVPISFWL